MRVRLRATLVTCSLLLAEGSTVDLPSLRAADDELIVNLLAQRGRLTEQIRESPRDVNLYSRRGDVLFFLGEFSLAVADYDQMIERDPDADRSHWRRGIALFYTGEFAGAADQFERYHSFDNVDRENGIWRYLSQYQAHGKEQARLELLKYEKDDRQPFPDVYRLFSGTITSEEVLDHISGAEISATEREKRRFYARLYIGLNEFVEGRPKTARAHLQHAANNRWAPEAGYGPHFMWHVARLHLKSLDDRTDKRE